ncbi:MAG: NADH-quinone oxidoreductase subunit J [Rhodobacteraceae bacterium]|nr:MAG: NADH-quinone oxidoreductase subunit J [Paracoccaceae bacterium]
MIGLEGLLASFGAGGSALPALPVTLPLIGAALAFAVGGRAGAMLALVAHAATVLATGVLIVVVATADAPVSVALGGWHPPLGIALRADGFAAAVLGVAAAVLTAVAAQATGAFWPPARRARLRAARGRRRVSAAFWPLLLMLSAAMATLVLAADLFTLHVAIELLTFAAAPLLCLDGRADTLKATLRYVLFALLGSMLYVAGIVILYGFYGTLDLALLSVAVEGDWPTVAALGLMTAGLAAKTALAPLHLWLPPAHAGAPAVVSAVLSGLVAKGGFVVLVRIWFDMAPGVATEAFVALMGALGLTAVALGSLVALQQSSLKRMIAYSTVAQIGYLFVLFPLAFDPEAQKLTAGAALAGGALQFMTHASAKAALFLAAGVLVERAGADALARLRGAGRRAPLAALAMGLALLALAGAPPGGGWAAKALGAAAQQSFWSDALTAAGALTAGYLGAALVVLLQRCDDVGSPLLWRGAPALALAALASGLGLAPLAGLLPMAAGAAPTPDVAEALAALPPLAVGAALALIFGEAGEARPRPRARGALIARAVDALRGAARRVVAPALALDAGLARWSAASVVLLAMLAALLASLSPSFPSPAATIAALSALG